MHHGVLLGVFIVGRNGSTREASFTSVKMYSIKHSSNWSSSMSDDSEEEISDAEQMANDYINGNFKDIKEALNKQESNMAAVGLFISALNELKERGSVDIDTFCRRVASWQ